MKHVLIMELTVPIQNTLKINSKKGYVLVDPETSDEAKVVILNDGNDREIQQTVDNLVIYGPGDFEASGILIKGTRPENGTMYSIDTGEGKILTVVSNSIEKLTDEDDYDVVAVKVVSPIEESVITSIASRLVVVYGDAAYIPETIKANKSNKINLKKQEELTSNIVYLEKK